MSKMHFSSQLYRKVRCKYQQDTQPHSASNPDLKIGLSTSLWIPGSFFWITGLGVLHSIANHLDIMIQARKTNAPRVSSCKGTSWIIRVMYYVTSGQKGVDKKTTGYASEKDALLEATHFRHALESSSRTKPLSWKPIMKRSAQETIEMHSKTNQLPQYSLLNCVHCSGLLSTAELKSFKRSCRFDKLEEEFNDDCEKDPCFRERFKNIFNANFYSEREARCMKRSLALAERLFQTHILLSICLLPSDQISHSTSLLWSMTSS